ncbi:MAG TPA: DUF1552 domain-containing protein [Polyangiaceae bacterium]|jgi:hypothetical protein|nr:DUF1552 domain-containing protein [Polyangiaceae bacterium]
MNRFVSRRTILRGAGVALSLPWLESLAPRSAMAQEAGIVRRRYMPIFLPNGAAELWKPTSQGAGAAWQLSSVLQPLAALKAKMIVLTNLENGTAFNANGGASVEPSHGRQPGAWLTCIDPGVVRAKLGVSEANNISLDQTMAKNPTIVANTPIKSMQVGLSTWYSFCDGQPCSNSRTVSWNDAGKPMYKSVDPLEVFNKLIAVSTPTGMPDADAQKRALLNKSVLDAVLENATRTQTRLGVADRAKLDEFLTSVRSVEKQATMVSTGMGGLACMPIAKPTMAQVLPDKAKQNSATYNKGTHADVMNDLIVMAFQCDATRIITYMLEDERSEFIYNHVTKRNFTDAGSTETTGTCPEYHGGGQHGAQNDFAAITWWNVGKVAALCAKLDAIKEGDKSILDNCVIMFGGAMHGSNHACDQLPITLIGSGGGKLKMDQHVVFTKRWLRDLHYTVMKDVFGMSGPGVDDFGIPRADNLATNIKEILA